MSTTHNALEQFFNDYATRFTKAIGENPEVDVETFAGAFADWFIDVGPAGIVAQKNDEQFRAALPQWFESYRTSGARSIEVGLLTTMPLNKEHSIARVHWETRYLKAEGKEETITSEIIYFVKTVGENLKIFGLVTVGEE